MRYPTRLVLLIAALSLALSAGCGGSGGARTTEPAGTLTGDDLTRTAPSATRLQDLIEGRIPGLTFTEGAGGRVLIRLRGISSFSGHDQPLIVVDDIPVDLAADGSIPGVVVSEIARIRVLKDPAETSRYGMRGAHGVIVITTKRGTGR
ncbi:TonB-dependent receptor plug domain-containing protein [Rhodocaloribacter litoris]|uniref:TonB-dependent receptor plug domain-containing protein n=1 Tax=Rhodocaloribacter litoris TaxID=2558931 RepID=UPI00141DEC51|nr:TonB-dependent receptor plug domain-containing protein [Rhodocaloribacter litoris]QXD16588.1 TonB-dependent receptor plug domain-containing protein [Rhodocaloribacter litoris]